MLVLLWVVVALVVLPVVLAFAAFVADVAGRLEPTVVGAAGQLVANLVGALVLLELVVAVTLWLGVVPQCCFEPVQLPQLLLRPANSPSPATSRSCPQTQRQLK